LIAIGAGEDCSSTWLENNTWKNLFYFYIAFAILLQSILVLYAGKKRQSKYGIQNIFFVSIPINPYNCVVAEGDCVIVVSNYQHDIDCYPWWIG
jgi:hypothetical protein